MKKVAVLLAFALASIGVVAVGAAPAGAAFTAYTLGDLNGQNGWDGGIVAGNPVPFTDNFADSNVITDTEALTGTQSWRYSGSFDSAGAGTPFTPDVATVGALNAIDAGSPIEPDGNESVVTFAFKAVVPGDGSSINVYEGSYNRDDRTGASLYLQNDTANGNPADTVSLFNFSANDDSPNCTTAQVDLGSVSVGAWHTVEMTTTYGDVTVGEPSTFGSTTYIFDKGTVDEQTVVMQSAPHAQRDCSVQNYVPGGSLKFANDDNDYPTPSGFYIDDLSMTVRNTVSDTVVGELATSFEANPCTTVCFVSPDGSGDESGRDANNAIATIQAGIDTVVAGGTVNVAAGLYEENVTIAKALDLVGAGPDDTIIDPTADGPAISISAGGTSLTDRLKIRLLKTTGASTSGNSASGIAFVGTDPIDHVTIDSVQSVGNAAHGVAFVNSGAMTDLVFNNDSLSNNGTDPMGDGIYISGDPTIDGLTITNSNLDSNALGGMEIYVDPSATNLSNTHVQNVLVEDTTFDDNASKGVYAERLKDAVFRRVHVENTATPGNAAFPFPAGIELDLKYQDYSGITIEDSDILTNGNTDTPQATSSSGIAIKARGTGTDVPFEANPATLTDVTITESRITANVGAGVRIGEPAVNNTGPTDVHVNQNSITGNTIGPSPFGLENVSTNTVDGVCNWWGATDGPSGAGPGTGDAVSSNVTFSPFKTISAADRCPPTVPDAPIDAVVTAGDHGLSVSFTTPDNGGFAITSYTATCASTVPPYPEVTDTSAGSPVFVSPLDVGVVHVCLVFATNALGDSADSNYALGTPADVPDAPTAATAFAGDESATVSWTAPANNGGSPITGYTVTSSPDGETCSWTTGPLACTVSNLTNGTDYTFTVEAVNLPGTSDPSDPSNVVTPLDWAGHFHPVVPARILDTRTANGGHPAKATAGETFNLQVTGQGGVPASGVTAVVMNVTVTNPTAPSFLTIWPEGTARPLVSNLNFVANQTRPNLVTVKVGLTGMVSIFNGSGSTHVVGDVFGWYSDDTVVGGSRFQALVPDRILDTRTGNGHTGMVGAGQFFDLQVTGRGGVPSTGVTAVVINVTVTNPTAQSFLTIWPEGAAQPTASNLNFLANQTVPNLVTVKVGPTGMVSIFNGNGSTHVVGDVAGWYSDTSVVGGSRFEELTPARILDTRTSNGSHPTVFTAGETFNLQVTGRGNVPLSGVTAVVLNVTVTNPTALSFLTIWPEGDAQPTASNLNFVANQTVPNLVVVKVGPDGKISIFNGAGTVNVVADVFGWFKAPSEP